VCGIVAVVQPTAAEVYEELAPAVRGYFLGRGATDPDDLTGDVFVRVAERLGGFRGDRAALRRWVFTIAHNRLVDEYRRSGRRPDAPMAAPPDTTPTSPVPESLDPDLLAALAELTDDQRAVVVLRFVADLPVRDVAKVLGRRSGAVKMLQARGLEALRVALEPGRT
jgi:RNA polymerase sigma-70 factor (ECF subfamily)